MRVSLDEIVKLFGGLLFVNVYSVRNYAYFTDMAAVKYQVYEEKSSSI
jgi:hypothetical protein